MGRASAHSSGLASNAPTVSHVGRYRIVRRLGFGAGTEVLLAAVDGPYGLERAVVVKRLLPTPDEIRPRLFAREAIAYSKLSHPAIVRLYDVIAEGGELALVLEYVDGCSLGRLLQSLKERGERLPDASAAWITMRIFAALEAAHTVPVVHRDITPSNILVPWDGYAKLADFGLAKVAGVASDTHLGVIKGTYGYMAPEQVLGDVVTPRTDVYQAMLVAYELFRGSPAFLRDLLPDIELLHAMAEGWVVPMELVRSELPPAWTQAMRLALRPSARERAIEPAEITSVLRASFDVDGGRIALVDAMGRLGLARDQATFVQPPSTPSREIGVAGMELLRSVHPPPRAAEPEPTPKHPISMLTEVSRPVRRDSQPTMRPQPTPLEVVPLSAPIPPPAPVPVFPAPPVVEFDDSIVTDRAPPRRTWIVVVVVAAVLAMLAVAWATYAVARSRSAPPIAHTLHVQSRLPRRAPDVVVAPSPQKFAPPTTGTIKSPASTSTNRFWLDGQLIGAGGDDHEVVCGRHIVKIGSRGRNQVVDVPCGGDVAVTR